MNRLDRALQQLRADRAMPWIPPNAHVLDIGCADGPLFRRARHSIASGVGIDLDTPTDWPEGPFEFRLGRVSNVVRQGELFDAIVMLAVAEHLPDPELRALRNLLPSLLPPGGRVIITVPSPLVDHILHVATSLHLLDGMGVEEHHGFRPTELPGLLATDTLVLRHHSRFEMALNHLFVFEKAR